MRRRAATIKTGGRVWLGGHKTHLAALLLHQIDIDIDQRDISTPMLNLITVDSLMSDQCRRAPHLTHNPREQTRRIHETDCKMQSVWTNLSSRGKIVIASTKKKELNMGKRLGKSKQGRVSLSPWTQKLLVGLSIVTPLALGAKLLLDIIGTTGQQTASNAMTQLVILWLLMCFLLFCFQGSRSAQGNNRLKIGL